MPGLPAELTAQGLLDWRENFGSDDFFFADYFEPDRNPVIGNSVAWRTDDMSRDIAKVVAYNAKGELRDVPATTHYSTVAPTLREKSEIPPEFITWLVSQEDNTQAAGQRKVSQAQRNLVNLVYRRHESWRSQVYTNSLTYTQAGHTVTVTVGIPSAHLPATVTASWATVGTNVLADLRAAMRTVQEDSGETPDTLIVGGLVMEMFLRNTDILALISDQLKTGLGERGTRGFRIPGVDLDVFEVNTGYVPDGGSFTNFVADNSCIMCPADPNVTGLKLIECRSPDDRAGGEEQRGLWTHAWQDEEPPASTWVHAEHTGMVVCENPRTLWRWTNVTAT